MKFWIYKRLIFLFLILKSASFFPGLRPTNLEIPLHCTFPDNLTPSPVQYIGYSSFYVCALTMPLAFSLSILTKKGWLDNSLIFCFKKQFSFILFRGKWEDLDQLLSQEINFNHAQMYWLSIQSQMTSQLLEILLYVLFKTFNVVCIDTMLCSQKPCLFGQHCCPVFTGMGHI